MENSTIEYQELDRLTGKLPESFVKSVVAFANTDGGKLYLGVRDDGSVAGVEDPDAVMVQVCKVMHDSIAPDIMPYVSVQPLEQDGRQVVLVTVSVGSERPYYLTKAGLKPHGVYVRRGSACMPADEHGIRRLIMKSAGLTYEGSISLEQELTFTTLNATLSSQGLSFGSEQQKILKLRDEQGRYCNLALLLSEQCRHTIKVAYYQGADKDFCLDRHEFSGSLLTQLKEVSAHLNTLNRTSSSIVGLERREVRDYPEEVLREALLNCIVHRDYQYSASTIINVYEDRMEFISLGGLVEDWTVQELAMGVSQSRNPQLASLFYRLKLAEGYGTGIAKILKNYPKVAPQSIFEMTAHVFKVMVPNRNAQDQTGYRAGTSKAAENPSYRTLPDQTQPQAASEDDRQPYPTVATAREYLTGRERITRLELQEALKIGKTKAFTLLKALCAEGALQQEGAGKLTQYRVLRRQE